MTALYRSTAARSRLRLILEELEARTLLSASSLDNLGAQPQVAAVTSPPANDSLTAPGDAMAGKSGGSTITNPTVPAGAYTPAQIRQAYGYSQLSFPNGSNGYDGTGGAGSGQTIAIVDVYNDPSIASDANKFSSTFGLPLFNSSGGPTLKVVNENGYSTSLPATNSSWATEISLDVEWAHSIAPQANIVLVEASSQNISDVIKAVDTAAHSGASVVSMSWGYVEFSGETGYDSHFNVPGVTFVAASGDAGAYPGSTSLQLAHGTNLLWWPSASPLVLSVGGTTLPAGGTETGWSGSGGGISAYEKLPAYQPGSYTNGTTTGTSGMRMNPDVAYDANPDTGFAVYDTVSYNGQTGWFQWGGTSAGTPQWAALVALADQQRGSNLSTSQTLQALYTAGTTSGDFTDITTGNNYRTAYGHTYGYSAGAGYDLVTGLGSPHANLLVPYLAGSPASGTTVLTATASGGGTTTGLTAGLAMDSAPASIPGQDIESPTTPLVTPISRAAAAIVPASPPSSAAALPGHETPPLQITPALAMPPAPLGASVLPVPVASGAVSLGSTFIVPVIPNTPPGTLTWQSGGGRTEGAGGVAGSASDVPPGLESRDRIDSAREGAQPSGLAPAAGEAPPAAVPAPRAGDAEFIDVGAMSSLPADEDVLPPLAVEETTAWDDSSVAVRGGFALLVCWAEGVARAGMDRRRRLPFTENH